MKEEDGVKLSQTLYARAEKIWPRYLCHPFVTQMADGTLPPEKFRYYMLQDYLYLKDYVKIVCEKRSLLVYNTLSNFTASLPPDRFLRIHRSYTVAVDKIDWMDGNSVEVLGTRLPLTRKYLSEEQQKILR